MMIPNQRQKAILKSVIKAVTGKLTGKGGNKAIEKLGKATGGGKAVKKGLAKAGIKDPKKAAGIIKKVADAFNEQKGYSSVSSKGLNDLVNDVIKNATSKDKDLKRVWRGNTRKLTPKPNLVLNQSGHPGSRNKSNSCSGCYGYNPSTRQGGYVPSHHKI